MSIGAPFPKNVTELKDDPIYQVMKKQMLKMVANIKNKLYILDALPRLNVKYITKIVALLKSGEDPVDIDVRLSLHSESNKPVLEASCQPASV